MSSGCLVHRPRLALALMMLTLYGATGHAADGVSWQQIQELPQPESGEAVPYADQPSQFGKLYLPDGHGPFPVVVLIHGGCWRVEYGIDHVAPLADDLRRSGAAVWSLEYRRLGEDGGGFPGTFDDIVAGFERLEELAEDNPLDLDRVLLTGHSAGGHLALWLAARNNLPEDHRWHAEGPDGLQGVVALAAISDLARYAEGGGACNRAAADLFGASAPGHEERIALASPDRLLPPGTPLHLVHGRADDIVPLEQSVVHAARVRAAGGQAKRHLVEGAGHFDLIAPFAPAWDEARAVILDLLGVASGH